MSGIRIVARSAMATVCAVAALGPLAGVAAAAEPEGDGPPFGNGGGNGPEAFQAEEPTDVPPDDTTTTTAAAEEPPPPDPEPTTPPPTQPQQPPPTQPQQPPPTVTPTTPTTPPPTPTTQPPTPTTRPPGTTTPPPSVGPPTTARPIVRAPVIVFPTKVDGAVSSSTSAPGEVASTEPKTAVKTVPAAGGDTTTTSEDPGDVRVAGQTQERGNGTGDLAASSFEDNSSSLLPSSTLGAILLVALVGFLAAGAYCGWLLVFARR